MPRRSRHRSHKGGQKRDDVSDSEDEVRPKEKKSKAEELAGSGGSGTRVLRDLEQEKRKPSANDKDADFSVECGKKMKDGAGDVVAGGRWIGGDGDDKYRAATYKKSRNEEFGSSKSKASAVVESKSSKFGSRHEGPRTNEDLVKQRYEKELSRREKSSSQNKDMKERERERGSERDKKVHDAKHGKHDDSSSRNKRSKREEDRKKDFVSAEWQIQEELRNPELEKELDKRINKRKYDSGDKDKWSGDGRYGGDEHLSSKEDHTKCGSYNDDKHIGGTNKEKHREEPGKDQRHKVDRCSRDDRDHKHWDEYSYQDENDKKMRDDRSSRDERDQRHRDDRSSREDRDYKHRDEKHRDDRAPRDRASDRYDSSHFRDDKKSSESCYKTGKYYDNDLDGGPCIDYHGKSCGRKNISDENDDYNDLKPRSLRELRDDVEKSVSSVDEFDCNDAGKFRTESCSEKVYSTLPNNEQKYSPSSSVHAKGQIRSNSKQAESKHRGSTSDDRLRFNAASTRDHAGTLRVIERVAESRSMLKMGSIEESYSSEVIVETTTPRYDRTPRSEAHVSPNKATEKSPGERRFADRIDSRRSHNIEEGGSKSSFARETLSGEGSLEKPILDNVCSQMRESTPTGSLSYNRSSYFSGSSSHLSRPPAGYGAVDSRVLGSYDDSKGNSRERKANGRFRRSGDLSVGRGSGTNWRSAWPSPVGNGFLPPPSGFHPNVQRFPGTPLFGIRPPMDLSHTGLPHDLHEAADRFSGGGRPFGWHNARDDFAPHLQVWDGRNGMFGDESHAYGRPEYQSRHLMGSRGWEMGPDMWRGQSGSINMELPLPQKELKYSSHALPYDAWAGQSGNRPPIERPQPQDTSVERVGLRCALETEKIAAEAAREGSHEETPELPKTPNVAPAEAVKPSSDDDASHMCSGYLSKVEISTDLVPQELYEKCMSLLKPRVPDDVRHDEVPHEDTIIDDENNIEALKSTGYIISHLFPTIADDAFPRAIYLYKMQSEATKAKASLSLLAFISRDNGSSAPSNKDVNMVENDIADEEKDADTVEDDSFNENVNEVENHNDHSPVELSQAATASTNNTDEERCVPKSSDCDMKEPQPELVTCSHVFVEGSGSSEALISECRVNLSRIPTSPESTY